MTHLIKPLLMTPLRLALPLLLLCFTSTFSRADTNQAGTTPLKSNPSQPATVVLIIDDMGNGMSLGQRAIALPGPINYAFLPHSPSSKILAESAHRHGKEVMLHIPMSNLQDLTTGPGTLRPIMEHQQFLETLYENLAAIPHVRGVNNHMGSLLTQLREPMGWLMSELKQRNLYFIDSRTSPLSVAESQANAHQLATRHRDVFLDNERTPEAIGKQFERLITLAKQQGIAVAIGHPHPETLEFLERAIPTLADRGIKLSLASEALNANTQKKCHTPSTAAPNQTNNCSQALALAKTKNAKSLTE